MKPSSYLGQERPKRIWLQRGLVAAWFVALVAAFVWLSRPGPKHAPPPGWSYWKATGATLALALTDDGVFAGGSRGLFHVSAQGVAKRINIPELNGPIIVYALLMGSDGILWVGHSQGLSLRTTEGWSHITKEDGLPDEAVKAITRTGDGALWLGTDKGAVRLDGLDRTNGNFLSVLTSQDGLIHPKVSVILEDADGGLWFGNYAAPEGGLSRLKGNQWQHWTTKEGLPHPNVTSLMLDKEGRVWAGFGLLNKGGGAIFSSSSGVWAIIETLSTPDLAGPKLRSIAQDSKGRVWLGSEYDGIAIRQNGEVLRLLTVDDGLPAQEAMVIVEANDGSIWLGTLEGVVHISADAVEALFKLTGNSSRRKLL